MLTNSVKWLSFHIYLSGSANEYIKLYLPMLIEDLEKSRLVKRFFFIRYGEGGYHVRLRLMPYDVSMRESIEQRINLHISKVNSSNKENPLADNRYEKSSYSREEHYFGENMETVYSELINEQTSRLALKMAADFSDSKALFTLKSFPSLYFLFEMSAESPEDFRRSLKESMDFVRNSGLYEKSADGSASEFPSENLVAASLTAVTKMTEKMQSSATLIKVVKLLRRAKKLPKGRFTATHSIHLYCNKLDFTMSQELKLYRLIEAVSAV